MKVSPETKGRKMSLQNSHGECSSDGSRNSQSHTNPEHPLKAAEESLLCITNLIREKARLQHRDCKGKPWQSRARKGVLGSHRHPPSLTCSDLSKLEYLSP